MQMTESNTAGLATQRRAYPPGQRLTHQVWRSYLRVFRPGKFNKFKEQRYRPMTDNHSCRPFDQYRCIFVHIPKCAGISVSRSLFGNVSGAHHTLRKFQIMFAPDEFASYFKFSFVRNPWDRLVSAFHFLKKGGLTTEDKQWSDRYLSPFPDFGAFVKNGLSQRRIFSFPHFRPQLEYICVSGKTPGLDFIGSFENLDSDFQYICKVLNNPASLLSLNRNASRKEDFREYYNDHTREMVGRLYADDIRVLGYSFENPTAPTIPSGRNPGQ
jgi:hypothetical protein